MVLTLFVNDPMGNRCRINLDAAMKIKAEYPVHIEVVKKGSERYNSEENPPACPSVMLDGRLLKEYGVMTPDEIKAELLRFML